MNLQWLPAGFAMAKQLLARTGSALVLMLSACGGGGGGGGGVNPIPGAPRLGEVSLGSSSVPLIGVQADPATFTDPSCPSLFPDSVLQ